MTQRPSPPGSYRELAELATVVDTQGQPSAPQMIAELARDQEAVVRTARQVFPLVDETHDKPTADLLTQRMQVHEKTAWMLRAMLADQVRPRAATARPESRANPAGQNDLCRRPTPGRSAPARFGTGVRASA